MTGILTSVDRWWFKPAPAARLGTLRILLGTFALVYLLVRARYLSSFSHFSAGEFAPVGPIVLLQGPLPDAAAAALVGAAILMGIAFVLGWHFRLSGPAFAVLLLWVLSYRNSWGMVFHTENLAVLHVLILGLAPSADARSLDARSRTPPADGGHYGWAIRLMCVLTVITYVIAGIAKLELSGWDWVQSDILRNYVAYDNLRKVELGDAHSVLGGFLVRHGWLFPPLAFISLAMELGAPLALLGRRAAALWCVGAWLFHLGVLAIMAIFFPYPLLGMAYAPFFRVERAVPWVRRRLARERAGG